MLLVLGRLGGGAEQAQVIARGAGAATELTASGCSFVTTLDRAGPDRRDALVVVFPADWTPTEVSLDIRTGRRTARVRERALAGATMDLRTLLRQHLAPLSVDVRRRLLALIIERAEPELARTGSYSLATNMHLVRDALREPMPLRVRTMGDRQAVQVERLLSIDERSFWVRGWASDRIVADTHVDLVSPEGHRIAVLEDAQRHARPDVDQFFSAAQTFVSGVETGAKHGFIKYFELPSPSLVSSGWVAELKDPGGTGVESEGPPVTADLPSVRHGIMNDLAGFSSWELDDELLCEHAQPALARLSEQLRASARVDTVTQYGEPGASPDVSVIVPLYGRIDFMEHQLCQFMHDPYFREIDLIYVLDSPELGEQLAESAAALHALYELPFRTATLSRNAGFAIANNLGASLARGRLLLLLNSDVVPDAPGWVRTLAAFYDATPAIGALGPKLLYEDGSLQHAGLYFDREPGASLWRNLHYFKGLESDFPPANVTRPVPAVTGACLMIDRSLWEDLDGLSPAYVQGGYEDSDLCLRLLEAGRDNWYLPHVELHHLEDQSFPSESRRMATGYNTWLQTHLWGERIEDLMREESLSAEPVGLLIERPRGPGSGLGSGSVLQSR